MRPMRDTVGAATPGSWLRVNHKQTPFNLGFGVNLTNGASLTYQVQHTFDDPERRQNCSISRSGTTATLTLTDHGGAVGDSVVVTGAGAPFDGTYPVASAADANTLTYTVDNSGATSATTDVARVVVLRVQTHDTVTGKTASDEGTYTAPIQLIRLNVTAYTSGKATINVVQGGL